MIEKEKILNSTRQGLAIFEYYIPALKENGAKKNFKAVFRDDGDNPDANVFINKKTKIWNYRDFVSGETLNPFDFVMRKEKCDFKNAIEIIVSKIMKTSTMEFTNIPKTEKITDIFITHCDDFKYWEQYINDKKRIRDIATRMNLVSVK
ncbi:hypothetical protein EOM09_06405, partial [bacterium]|nr:hypothetical protein [bacterium]